MFRSPQHPYTRELLSAEPSGGPANTVAGPPLLQVEDLKVWFPIKKGLLRKTVDYVKAVDGLLPDNCLDVWRLRRLARYLDSIDGREDLKRLFKLRGELELSLSRLYQDAVVKRTWLRLSENATPSVRAALELYRTAIRKIGKGTGVRAGRYRQDARLAADVAISAIPCWIMPHYRICESLPAQYGAFDLVIIDEASQSDLTALPALLRAKKVLVVGEECLSNVLASEGLPDVPLWLIEDAQTPYESLIPSRVDVGLAAQIAGAPSTPFPKDIRAGISAESTTLLIFTSGTTGLPKAARYSHMRWMSSGDVMEVTMGTTSDDVFYCCLPLYHGAAATSVTSTALRCGASIVVRRKFSVREFWQDVRRHQITVFQYIDEADDPDPKQHVSGLGRDHSIKATSDEA